MVLNVVSIAEYLVTSTVLRALQTLKLKTSLYVSQEPYDLQCPDTVLPADRHDAVENKDSHVGT
jgi:hypothetical protein